MVGDSAYGFLKKKWVELGVLVSLAYGISGCSAPLKQQATVVRDSPISNEYKLERLKEDVYVNYGEAGIGQDKYRSTISNSLVEILEKYDENNDGLRVHSFSDLVNGLNRKGLADDYGKMMDFHQRYGMFKKEDLIFLGKNLEAEYIIQPILLEFKQSDKTRFGLFGLKLINTQIADVKIGMEIWDLRDGYKKLDLVGELTRAGESLREKPISLGESLKQIYREMVERLPQEDEAEKPFEVKEHETSETYVNVSK